MTRRLVLIVCVLAVALDNLKTSSMLLLNAQLTIKSGTGLGFLGVLAINAVSCRTQHQNLLGGLMQAISLRKNQLVATL